MNERFRQMMEARFVKQAVLGASMILASTVMVSPAEAFAQTQTEDVRPLPSPSALPLFLPPKEVTPPPLGPVFHPNVRPALSSLPVGEPLSLSEQRLLQAKLPEYKKQGEIIAHDPRVIEVFKQIHDMSESEITESLSLYYPLYRIASERSDVNLWHFAVVHASETRFSQDKGLSGYVGAMQRDRSFYPDTQVLAYAAGFDFLSTLPLRNNRPLNTWESTDYQEVLWASLFIKTQSQSRYPELDFEEAVNQFLTNNYASPEFGPMRVQHAKQLQAIPLLIK